MKRSDLSAPSAPADRSDLSAPRAPADRADLATGPDVPPGQPGLARFRNDAVADRARSERERHLREHRGLSGLNPTSPEK